MRENEVESYLKDQTALRGWRSYKWVSPGVRGVPDQIVLAAVPSHYRALIARCVRFIETKATDKQARGQQLLRHDELRALGFTVHGSIDSKQKVDGILREMGA